MLLAMCHVPCENVCLTQSSPPTNRYLSKPQEGNGKRDDVGSYVPNHHHLIRVCGDQLVRHGGSGVSSYPGAEVDYGSDGSGGEGEEDCCDDGLCRGRFVGI